MDFGSFKMDPIVILYGWILLLAFVLGLYLAIKIAVCRKCDVCGKRSVFLGRCLNCDQSEPKGK